MDRACLCQHVQAVVHAIDGLCAEHARLAASSYIDRRVSLKSTTTRRLKPAQGLRRAADPPDSRQPGSTPAGAPVPLAHVRPHKCPTACTRGWPPDAFPSQVLGPRAVLSLVPQLPCLGDPHLGAGATLILPSYHGRCQMHLTASHQTAAALCRSVHFVDHVQLCLWHLCHFVPQAMPQQQQ